MKNFLFITVFVLFSLLLYAPTYAGERTFSWAYPTPYASASAVQVKANLIFNYHPTFVSGSRPLASGDIVCVGDSVTITPSYGGEWFFTSGYINTPPIVWVSSSNFSSLLGLSCNYISESLASVSGACCWEGGSSSNGLPYTGCSSKGIVEQSTGETYYANVFCDGVITSSLDGATYTQNVLTSQPHTFTFTSVGTKTISSKLSTQCYGYIRRKFHDFYSNSPTMGALLTSTSGFPIVVQDSRTVVVKDAEEGPTLSIVGSPSIDKTVLNISEWATMQIVLKNTGDMTAKITAISFHAGPSATVELLTPSSLPILIEPGNSYTVRARVKFSLPGDYTISLRVPYESTVARTCGDRQIVRKNLTREVLFRVEVRQPEPPTLTITPSRDRLYIGEDVTFTLTSTKLPGGTYWFEVDYGDNTARESCPIASPQGSCALTHTYTTAGEKIVRGLNRSLDLSARTSVIVYNLPNCSFSVSQANPYIGENVDIRVSFRNYFADLGKRANFTINCGNGETKVCSSSSSSGTCAVSCIYLNPGEYTIRVSDMYGLSCGHGQTSVPDTRVNVSRICEIYNITPTGYFNPTVLKKSIAQDNNSLGLIYVVESRANGVVWQINKRTRIAENVHQYSSPYMPISVVSTGGDFYYFGNDYHIYKNKKNYFTSDPCLDSRSDLGLRLAGSTKVLYYVCPNTASSSPSSSLIVKSLSPVATVPGFSAVASSTSGHFASICPSCGSYGSISSLYAYPASSVVSNTEGSITAISSHGSEVFYVRSLSSGYEVLKAQSGSQPLHFRTTSPRISQGIAVNKDWIMWTEYNITSPNPDRGVVYAKNRSSGRIGLLDFGGIKPTSIVADDDVVYWTEQNEVKECRFNPFPGTGREPFCTISLTPLTFTREGRATQLIATIETHGFGATEQITLNLGPGLTCRQVAGRCHSGYCEYSCSVDSSVGEIIRVGATVTENTKQATCSAELPAKCAQWA